MINEALRLPKYESSHPNLTVIEKIDRYLRRSDTAFSLLVNSVCPYKGKEYLNSRYKRLLDLLVAVPAVIITTPIIIILGFAKKLEDGESVFFVQERLGRRKGESIDLIKIRCMQPNSDFGRENLSIARGLTAAEDPRNTRLGTFMRRFQLEELPQLFQVIQGKLSVIGIRSNTQYGFDNLQEVWDEERYGRWAQAYQSGPLGLSGMTQVFGRGLKEDEKRFHSDVFYTKNASLGLDLYLLWKTALRLIGSP